MKHATSIALYEYWQRRHDEAPVTASRIRAAELAPILASLFLLEGDLAAGLHFRFCGANVARRYGRDLAGESFLTLWNAEDRQALEHHAKLLARRSTGLVAGMLAETVGGGFTSFELLILPLSGQDGMAGAIGSMERIGGHEEMNRIRARLVSQQLRSVRFLPAAKHLSRGEVTAPPAALVQRTPRRHGKYLSVVRDGA